jgi:hypothetical protein
MERFAGRRSALAWSLLGGAAIIAMLVSPHIWRFASALLPATVFLVAPIVNPFVVPRSNRALSPHNWALVILFVCTVGVPVLMVWEGPARGVLPIMPDDDAIGLALRLQAAVLVAFLVGLVSWNFLSARPRPTTQQSSSGLLPREIVLFALAGVAGLWLTFGSMDALFHFFSNPAQYANESAYSGARKGLGLILRPFLILGVIGWWSKRVAGRPSTSLRVAETAIAVIVIVVVGISYSFNRAAFAVPLVALLSTYSGWVRRTPLLILGLLSFVGIGSLLAIGSYRSSGFGAGDVLRDPAAQALLRDQVHPLDQLQVYGGGPQFTAFLIRANELSRSDAGGTLFGSLVSPVPVFGKPFRSASGPAVYNRLIYGTSTILDQLIPFPGELFINVGLLGTLLVFLALGMIVRQLDRYYEMASTPLQSYIAFYTTAWVLYLVPGSLSAVAQIFIYFFWPIYAYLVLQRWHNRRRSAGAPVGG